MNETFRGLGFYPANILLPRRTVDMTKWAVVACDQFTSQPDYWKAVAETVGDAPSTLHLILPEAHLRDGNVPRKVEIINSAMKEYLNANLFDVYEDSLFYIERTQSDGTVRPGLVGMVDLEEYDSSARATTLIRATEGTVFARIPPRIRVRQDAFMEIPHILLLIDDPEKSTIEPLAAETDAMESLYDFPLQQGGGHLKGWKLTERQMNGVADALRALATPEAMERKYGLGDIPPLLFAVGDGNHSLATARQCYETAREQVPRSQWESLPSRYALVEVVNNHNPNLVFHPIHRLLSGVSPDRVLDAFRKYYPSSREGEQAGHVIHYTSADRQGVLTVTHPKLQLPVATLQDFLDDYTRHFGGEIDYIHGDATADELGRQDECISFRLPTMEKDLLFKSVLADGALPRKTFSMGQAMDKRYYVEARLLR